MLVVLATCLAGDAASELDRLETLMKALFTEDELLAEWVAQLKASVSFHIAMALISKAGLDLVLEALTSHLDGGAAGKMLVGIDLPTDPQALSSLHKLQSDFPGQFVLRRFKPEKKRVFHPKLSIFVGPKGHKTAIIGSSNLTHGGFVENVEVNLLLDSRKEVGNLLKFFNVLFLGRNSQPVNTAWLKEYQTTWANRKKALDGLHQARAKVIRIKTAHLPGTAIPKRIKGKTFVFTGGLGYWNRRTALAAVKRYGGDARDTHPSVKAADCLVEGQINPCLESTRKLEVAREYDIPIIGPDEFLWIYENEKKLRKKKR